MRIIHNIKYHGHDCTQNELLPAGISLDSNFTSTSTVNDLTDSLSLLNLRDDHR